MDAEHHVLTTHLVMRPGSTREQIASAMAAAREMLDPQDFVDAPKGLMNPHPCKAKHPQEAAGGAEYELAEGVAAPFCCLILRKTPRTMRATPTAAMHGWSS